MRKEFTIKILEVRQFQELINYALYLFFTTNYPQYDIFATSRFHFQDNQILFDIRIEYYDVEIERTDGEMRFNKSYIRFAAKRLSDVNMTFCCVMSNANDSSTLMPTEDYKKSIEYKLLNFLF